MARSAAFRGDTTRLAFAPDRSPRNPSFTVFLLPPAGAAALEAGDADVPADVDGDALVEADADGDSLTIGEADPLAVGDVDACASSFAPASLKSFEPPSALAFGVAEGGTLHALFCVVLVV